MAVDINVKVSAPTLQIVRSLLEERIQAFFDDPYSVCEDNRQINIYHGQLRAACEELGIDWNNVLRRETTENERRRMWTILHP